MAIIRDLSEREHDAVVAEFVNAASSQELKSISAELDEMRTFVASEFGFDAGLAHPIPPPFAAWDRSNDAN